jgi:hypothetical protein
MNLRILLRHAVVLALIMFLSHLGGDFAAGSGALKGKEPAQSAHVAATTQEPCDTTVGIMYGATTISYSWKQPPLGPFLNQRYDMRLGYGGRLEFIRFGVYESHMSGAPDPDVYVWLSDGTFPLDNDPPSQAIGECHLQFDDMVYFPNLTTVEVYPLGIVLDPGELFHVGFSHAFDPGDTIAYLSNDGPIPNDWASVWGGDAWDSLAPYMFLVDVGICPLELQSTYTMECSPALASATPGDPPADLYQVQVDSVLGYDERVTLSFLNVDPPAGIDATFSPNGDPCPYLSDVSVVVDGGVPYGDYELTFRGVGGDGQNKRCEVTLRVGPPYGCGDVNADEIVDAGDLVSLIGSLFRGGDAPDPECLGDANCNGVIDIGDVVYLVGFLYRGGAAPCLDCCVLRGVIERPTIRQPERVTPAEKPR